MLQFGRYWLTFQRILLSCWYRWLSMVGCAFTAFIIRLPRWIYLFIVHSTLFHDRHYMASSNRVIRKLWIGRKRSWPNFCPILAFFGSDRGKPRKISRQPVSRLRFVPRISRVRSRVVNSLITTFDDGFSMLLWNVRLFIWDYATQYLRRLPSSWEPEFLHWILITLRTWNVTSVCIMHG
jgi:hypothetical protein